MEEKIKRIVLENVSKKFTRKYKRNKLALSKFISFFNNSTQKVEFDVLKNISFSVCEGENLGVIGKNGAGKSTLLKVIAGIYSPDSGIIKTNGKMIYVTGFGQGLNPRLTMAENIYLIGSIMGLSRKDIEAKFDEIVDFSGLGEFVNTQVNQFSSGMVSRLTFSISIHCIKHHNPDILLIDEVFGGGGDIDFQDKALKKMEELIEGGATVIFVSHGLDIVKKYCDRVILLDNGEIIKEGKPEEVVEKYLSSLK